MQLEHVATGAICEGESNALLRWHPAHAPYLIAVLSFDSTADLGAGLASPEGQAAAADVPNFASRGATLLIYDSKVV